jgi:type I restriction enzyme S subunit
LKLCCNSLKPACNNHLVTDMSTNTLLANFEVLAEAPNGIDRIREVILGLAVQGKLFKDTDLNKWQNGVSLKEFGRMIRGITYAKTDSSKEPVPSFIPLLGAANIQGSINYEGLTFVSSSLIKSDQYLKDGDILICMSSGSKHLVGKTGVVKNPPNSSFGAFCGVFRILEEKNRDYLALFFKSPGYRTAISDVSRGIGINNLRVGDIENIELSMPPEVEQKRIVAKVDELMALCDQLELQKQSRDNLRVATRKSAIDSISTANTPEAFETAWKRIVNNWEVIADTPESVGSLRSLILDLAVRGRLQNGAVQEFDPVSGLPIRWELQRLDQVCVYIQRGKGPQYADLSKYAVVSQKCVQWNGFDISKARFVDEQSLNSYGEERILRDGDILWNSTGTGTVGRTAIYFNSNLFEKVVADSHVTVLRAPDMNPQFLWSWTASPAVQSMITDLTSGTTNQQELNLSSIKSLLVPVPPLPEQNRIVTKVGELMAICDQLEAELEVRRDVAEKFARSVVSVSGSTEIEF